MRPIPNCTRRQTTRVLKLEEERFAETIDQGMRILDRAIAGLEGKVIPGMWCSSSTTPSVSDRPDRRHCARKALEIDRDGFEREMDAQRARARASQFGVDQTMAEFDIDGETDFTGYERQDSNATIVALFSDGASADELDAGQDGMVVLDRTPFYAESGGQAGDAGYLRVGGGAEFVVSDTRKQTGTVFAHLGEVTPVYLHR